MGPLKSGANPIKNFWRNKAKYNKSCLVGAINGITDNGINGLMEFFQIYKSQDHSLTPT